MPCFDVSIPTPDGSCPATLHVPSGSGPWPAVILYPDAFSVRPALLGMADRLSELGYVTLLPEVYYRHGPYEPFDARTAFSDPPERARLTGLMTGLSAGMMISDAG